MVFAIWARIIHMRRYYIFLLFVLLLAGCAQGSPVVSPPSQAQATEPPLAISPSPSQSQQATLPPDPTSTPIPPPVNTRYKLAAKFNFGLRDVAVDQSIVFTNNTGQVLNDLVMMVEPNNNPGVFRLSEFTWADGQAVRDFSLDANLLHINLPQPLEPRQQLQMHLVYELSLPEIPAPADDRRPVPFGYTDRQVNLVDWYPSIPPFIPGEGWLAHKPWYYGEHQVYPMADFDVTIQLVNPPQDLVLAASSPASQDGSMYSYTHINARNFVFSASPYYKVFNRQVSGVTILSYAFTFDTTPGKAALQYTAEALDLYNSMYALYPHDTLTVVEADFLDGMEYDGLYFLSRGFYNLYNGTPQGYLAAIAAHETAHQWFYARVGNDQALEPWLDEALCAYNEYVFYKVKYPAYLDWWWTYRVDYYDPAGKINLQLYDYTSYRAYRDAVYLNGVHFLDDLRQMVGDDSFYSFLRDYVTSFSNKIATGRDFFDLLSHHTSKNISPLLNKYFQ
jgi:hypothetical protein